MQLLRIPKIGKPTRHEKWMASHVMVKYGYDKGRHLEWPLIPKGFLLQTTAGGKTIFLTVPL